MRKRATERNDGRETGKLSIERTTTEVAVIVKQKLQTHKQDH